MGVLLIIFFIFFLSFNLISSNLFKITGLTIEDKQDEINSKKWVWCEEKEEGVFARYNRRGLFKWFNGKRFENFCEEDVLVKYSCDEFEPSISKKICPYGCKEGKCLFLDVIDDLEVLSCAINCDIKSCDNIKDNKKRNNALEQYTINCDDSMCDKEECARKLALLPQATYSVPSEKETEEDIFEREKECSGSVILKNSSIKTQEECLNFCKSINESTCCQFNSDEGFCYSRKGYTAQYPYTNQESMALTLYNNNYSKFPTPFEKKYACAGNEYSHLGEWNVKSEEECSELCEKTENAVCCEYHSNYENRENCFVTNTQIIKISSNLNKNYRDYSYAKEMVKLK